MIVYAAARIVEGPVENVPHWAELAEEVKELLGGYVEATKRVSGDKSTADTRSRTSNS
jgi:hypothetical protein